MIEFKDLTLREGAQVPGLQIDEAAGKAVLTHLDSLDVSRVEISFPRAAPRESWYRHADSLGLRTAALARAMPADIDAALAVDPDEVEVIIASSDIQLTHALGRSREQARDQLISSVRDVVTAGVDAGVTLMDAMRADEEYLVGTAQAAVDAGATHVTLADTTGAGTPDRVTQTVSSVVDAVGDDAFVAIHTHDDMGVATANAAAGVDAGATAVDATVGGIGERAGNAPLEEVAVLLTERGDPVAITHSSLVPVCRAIHETLGVDIDQGKPVIGERAYRHESGMHTAAMLAAPESYEPFDPARYGGDRELLFGHDSGRGAVRALLESIAVEPTAEAVAAGLAALRAAAEDNDGPVSAAEARRVLRERR